MNQKFKIFFQKKEKSPSSAGLNPSKNEKKKLNNNLKLILTEKLKDSFLKLIFLPFRFLLNVFYNFVLLNHL